MAFGLEDLIFFYAAELADCAVYGADVIRLRYWPGSTLERACEKIVEAFVAGGIGVQSFGHVHAVALDEPIDRGRRRAAAFCGCEFSHELREQFFREQVLREDG